jgi:hypothetical protein
MFIKWQIINILNSFLFNFRKFPEANVKKMLTNYYEINLTTECKRLRCRLHSICYKTGGSWWGVFFPIHHLVEKQKRVNHFCLFQNGLVLNFI